MSRAAAPWRAWRAWRVALKTRRGREGRVEDGLVRAKKRDGVLAGERYRLAGRLGVGLGWFVEFDCSSLVDQQ